MLIHRILFQCVTFLDGCFPMQINGAYRLQYGMHSANSGIPKVSNNKKQRAALKPPCKSKHAWQGNTACMFFLMRRASCSQWTRSWDFDHYAFFFDLRRECWPIPHSRNIYSHQIKNETIYNRWSSGCSVTFKLVNPARCLFSTPYTVATWSQPEPKAHVVYTIWHRVNIVCTYTFFFSM